MRIEWTTARPNAERKPWRQHEALAPTPRAWNEEARLVRRARMGGIFAVFDAMSPTPSTKCATPMRPLKAALLATCSSIRQQAPPSRRALAPPPPPPRSGDASGGRPLRLSNRNRVRSKALSLHPQLPLATLQLRRPCCARWRWGGGGACRSLEHRWERGACVPYGTICQGAQRAILGDGVSRPAAGAQMLLVRSAAPAKMRSTRESGSGSHPNPNALRRDATDTGTEFCGMWGTRSIFLRVRPSSTQC